MLKCVAVLAGGALILAGLHLHGHGCPGARLLALAGLNVCATAAPAEDKKEDKPALSGVWVLKGGEVKIVFSDKNVLKVFPHGNEVLVVLCKYTSGKEGLVTAKITDFEGKDEVKEKVKEKLPVGTEFSFKWKVKGDTAALDYQKGDEHLKSHLEGEYERKK
jgi:hypothetical protein